MAVELGRSIKASYEILAGAGPRWLVEGLVILVLGVAVHLIWNGMASVAKQKLVSDQPASIQTGDINTSGERNNVQVGP